MCDSATMLSNQKIWTPGGLNDYGGWILECVKCKNKFSIHIGRDVYYSNIKYGAVIIDKYDDEVGNKELMLKKYNLDK